MEASQAILWTLLAGLSTSYVFNNLLRKLLCYKGGDDRWRYNAQHMTSFVQEHSLTPIITNINCNDTKMHKNDVVGIVTFDLISLLPTNHIIT